jgi:hypothetical protein
VAGEAENLEVVIAIMTTLENSKLVVHLERAFRS